MLEGVKAFLAAPSDANCSRPSFLKSDDTTTRNRLPYGKLKWFSFFGFNATEQVCGYWRMVLSFSPVPYAVFQFASFFSLNNPTEWFVHCPLQHNFSTIGQTKNTDELAAAWQEHKLPGMVDVEDLHSGAHCPPRGCFKDGLYHRMW
jgi:hypothetical protein